MHGSIDDLLVALADPARRSLAERLTAFQMDRPSAGGPLGAALRTWLGRLEARWSGQLRAFSEHFPRLG
jgi:hypothetical protein